MKTRGNNVIAGLYVNFFAHSTGATEVESFVADQTAVAQVSGGQYSTNIFFQEYHNSRFYHDSLSC